MTQFNNKEKKNYLFKKYLKEHFFDFVFEIIMNVVFTVLIIFFCKGTEYYYGILLAFVYSLGKILYKIKYYKKEYIDVEVERK